MNPTRIAELLAPFLGPANDQRPTTDDLLRISTYIDLLLRWNTRINLTAIRSEEEIVTRHFGESLFAARHLFPRAHPVSPVPGACPDEGRVVKDFEVDLANDPRRRTNDEVPHVADLGSGAGFPGLPIKLWAPQISLTLIESNQKKAVFLREAVRALTLTNVDIQNTRAESLSPAAFDLVTLRAVERFENILPTASALVAPSGRLALLIGASQRVIAESTCSDLAWNSPLAIPGSSARTLLVAVSKSAGI